MSETYETAVSPLRQALDGHGASMQDLTVLAAQNDPFRIDTPARHRDGKWLADIAQELGLGNRHIHIRGLHYMIIGQPKPDGSVYTNTEKDWTWLSEKAAKAARWLGYFPFEQITDQRNDDPVIREFSQPDPYPYVNVGVHVDIPDADDLVPRIDIDDFDGVQPYRLVIVGEKSSLGPALGPVAINYHADLYLPTGEPSDTMLYRMARTGAEDGRPMVVFYFSDCDPAGWQMPVSVARKLQAFKVLEFGDLEFQVRRVALTPDQVRMYGLPSTPLKDTEKRADRWQQQMGVEQTEIDALAALRPELLRQIARDAFEPFFDKTLDMRVFEARAQWIDEAQRAVEEQADSNRLARIRAEAAEKLAAMRTEIEEINSSLRIDTTEFTVPEIVVPEAELDSDGATMPLLDSRWPFPQQCRRLIDSKSYQDGAQ